jgi:hypothetical protein
MTNARLRASEPHDPAHDGSRKSLPNRRTNQGLWTGKQAALKLCVRINGEAAGGIGGMHSRPEPAVRQ